MNIEIRGVFTYYFFTTFKVFSAQLLTTEPAYINKHIANMLFRKKSLFFILWFIIKMG